jgi:hypothetical protein
MSTESLYSELTKRDLRDIDRVVLDLENDLLLGEDAFVYRNLNCSNTQDEEIDRVLELLDNKTNIEKKIYKKGSICL